MNLSVGLSRAWTALAALWALILVGFGYVSMIGSTSPDWTSAPVQKVMANGLDISSLRPVGAPAVLPARFDWIAAH